MTQAIIPHTDHELAKPSIFDKAVAIVLDTLSPTDRRVYFRTYRAWRQFTTGRLCQDRWRASSLHPQDGEDRSCARRVDGRAGYHGSRAAMLGFAATELRRQRLHADEHDERAVATQRLRGGYHWRRLDVRATVDVGDAERAGQLKQ